MLGELSATRSRQPRRKTGGASFFTRAGRRVSYPPGAEVSWGWGRGIKKPPPENRRGRVDLSLDSGFIPVDPQNIPEDGVEFLPGTRAAVMGPGSGSFLNIVEDLLGVSATNRR